MSNGGPAFPMLDRTENSDNGIKIHFNHGGMSLHDYATVAFTSAWIAALAGRCNQPGYTDDGAVAEANRLGAIQADAMLAAREVKP